MASAWYEVDGSAGPKPFNVGDVLTSGDIGVLFGHLKIQNCPFYVPFKCYHKVNAASVQRDWVIAQVGEFLHQNPHQTPGWRVWEQFVGWMFAIVLKFGTFHQNIKSKSTIISAHSHWPSISRSWALSSNSLASLSHLIALANAPCVKTGAAEVHESKGTSGTGLSRTLEAAKQDM